MPNVIRLAHGTVHMSDTITVELVSPDGWPQRRTDPDAVTEKPPRIRIIWPSHSTVTTPASFDQVVANTMRLLSTAVIELAAIKVRKKL
jgi:hypothetical protein